MTVQDGVTPVPVTHDAGLAVPVLRERLAGMFHDSVTCAAMLTCKSPECSHGVWVDHRFTTADGLPDYPFEKCAVCASPLRVSHTWTRSTGIILEVKK